MENVNFPISCPSCGGNQFIKTDPPSNELVGTCSECGRVIVENDLKAAAIERARNDVPDIARDLIRKALKK